MSTNPNMEAIQTITATTSVASITFSNIPATYTDLKLVISPRSDGGTTANDGRMTFNGSASGYSSKLLYGLGSGTPSSASNSGTYMYWINSTNSNGLTASTFSNTEIYIPNYTSSNQKSVSCDTVTENNGTYGAQLLTAGLWTGTSAITSISFSLDYGNFVQHSSATLYGITNAAVGAKATGGIISQDADYFYHTFLASGTFTPTTNITGAEALVVAGGGGAARGGGGAGGLRGLSSQSFSNGTAYTVTIGGGGTAYSGDYINRGTNGSNSSILGSGFSTITASGGGGGGSGHGNTNGSGSSGGSGGGAGNDDDTGFSGGAGNAGGYTPVEGFAGGACVIYVAFSQYGSGGGGGAASAGQNNIAGGAGGNFSGLPGQGSSAYSSWGQATGTGHNVGGTYYYAGGGTARDSSYRSNGGGGASDSIPGLANTGGGSGATPSLGSGQTGGSGIVIVRYAK